MVPKNSYKISEEVLFNVEKKNAFNRHKDRYRLTIIKRFEFSFKFQSMSVIIRNELDGSYRFYMKGAPERILSFCRPETLPPSFDDMLMEHTNHGLRVLACATKPLPDRNDYHLEDNRLLYEKDLIFLGFVIFKNKLKRDTKQVIKNLQGSGCKLVMATGDNPFTSISVARECEMIEKDKYLFLIDMNKEFEDNTERLMM
jgi:magnesium-transporting ATPase (P-type)